MGSRSDLLEPRYLETCTSGSEGGKGQQCPRPTRLLHEDLEVVKLCKDEIEKWLSGIGLELKPSKTRITHTLNKLDDEKPGFDFLGFHIRQYPAGKCRSGKSTHREILGFKTIITPSKKSQKRHYRKVVEVIDESRGKSQAASWK